MARRLPPLNAVRAFEAAARHMSFRQAAAELHVTAGAVAQQVKQLEEWLGTPLFRRRPRGVILTDAGQLYGRAVAELLDRLGTATERVLAGSRATALAVSTVPSLAALWLIPRLGSFRARHPGLDVRVLASVSHSDFQREDVDVAIRLGRGGYPGTAVELLMPEDFIPVCSPRLLAGPAPLAAPADLRHHTLLHDEPEALLPDEVDWPRWLAAAGVGADIDTGHGPRFSHTHMTLQAAMAGQGVALASTVLAGDALANGTLVRPFPLALRGPYGFYLVAPEATAARPKVAAFWSWAIEQAAGTLDRPAL